MRRFIRARRGRVGKAGDERMAAGVLAEGVFEYGFGDAGCVHLRTREGKSASDLEAREKVSHAHVDRWDDKRVVRRPLAPKPLSPPSSTAADCHSHWPPTHPPPHPLRSNSHHSDYCDRYSPRAAPPHPPRPPPRAAGTDATNATTCRASPASAGSGYRHRYPTRRRQCQCRYPSRWRWRTCPRRWRLASSAAGGSVGSADWG